MVIETIDDLFQCVKGSSSKAGVFRCCLLIVLLIPFGTARAQTAPQFETPPTLPAQELAPATLLNGNGFHVDPKVPTDGLTAHFTLRSDVGTFNADGLEMLRIRVAELPAIVELNQTSKSKVFAQALATNAAAPVAAAGQMVMHPVDTVKGLPAGVGRFFGRVGLGAQKNQGGRDDTRRGLCRREGRPGCLAHVPHYPRRFGLRAGTAGAGEKAPRRSVHHKSYPLQAT